MSARYPGYYSIDSSQEEANVFYFILRLIFSFRETLEKLQVATKSYLREENNAAVLCFAVSPKTRDNFVIIVHYMVTRRDNNGEKSTAID